MRSVHRRKPTAVRRRCARRCDSEGGGGGGWKNSFAQHFFSHWPVYLFTVKAVQEIFSQIFPPPPPPPPPLKSQIVRPLYEPDIETRGEKILKTIQSLET